MADAKYQRGKIYTIRSNKTDLVYVGSTTQRLLCQRMAKHRNSFKRYKNGKYGRCSVFDIFEADKDCYIELYERYPCDGKMELEKREGEIIRLLDCSNKRIAGRKDKEYYENNREIILEKCSQKHTCECGGKYTHGNKAKHMKSTKHQDYVAFMNDEF